MARQCIALLMGLCAWTGCAGLLSPPVPLPPREARERLPVDFVFGNQVEVLNNGEVFPALEEEIARAKSSVHIEVFIWRPGPPSDHLTEVLLERVRQGVECRIIVDPLWSVGFAEEIQPRLAGAGCQVLRFLPLDRVSSAEELVQRQHRKLVVIDGEVGITGGFGIWRSWLGNGIGEDQWRDVAVRFRGPVVRQAQLVFASDWLELTGEHLPASSYPELSAEGAAPAMFVGSQAPAAGPTEAQHLHDWLLGTARERLWISNSYFVPSESILELLCAQARRGVDVRVLVPGDVHDFPFVLAAQRSGYARLLQAGVRIVEYQAAMMHSKVVVVDDRYASVGSINLDPLSLHQAREGSLVFADPALVEGLADDFRLDERLSKPVPPGQQGPALGLARFLMWVLANL